MTPLVTIAIPTFERLGYLREAASSALDQTDPRVEVLIGDDGTSEAIARWGQELAAGNPRVRYFHNPHTLGLAGNWNALADTARGEFITIIGDDDRLLPIFVERLSAVLAQGIDVAFSNHYLINAAGHRLEERSRELTRRYHRDRLPTGPVADPVACVWRNSVPMSAALVRTTAVHRLRYREDLNTPEIELFARLARDGGRFAFVREYLAEYRDHAASQTAAGLWSEPLARALIPLPVPAAAEPLKRAFLGPVLIDAVRRCLFAGEVSRARELAASGYFPAFGSGGARRAVHAALLRLSANLPHPMGCSAYRFLDRLARRPSGGGA
jgi:glycosyltransferase involved in cell wall biosynthesis